VLTAFIVISIITLLLTLPLSLRGHAFVSAVEGIAAANVGLFDLPQVALRIELDHGLVFRMGKIRKRLIKVTEKGIKPTFDLSILKKLRMRKVSVRGVFGADDAAVTAVGAAGLTGILKPVIDSVIPSSKGAYVTIFPDYDQARLELEITLRIEFNLWVVIGMLFVMIFNKKKNTKPEEKKK